MLCHNLGFPRIGRERELKKAMEEFWRGEIGEEELRARGRELRLRHWQIQKENGIDLVPVGDFSFYDQMLDMSALLGAVPPRYNHSGATVDMQTYYRMARGGNNAGAMEMTKWFDTNYHYLVPEFYRAQKYRISTSRLFDEVEEALAAGFSIKPVLPGPLTFVQLGKAMDAGLDRFDRLPEVVEVYAQVLERLAGKAEWIQLDEPALVLDLPERVRDLFEPTYERLREAAGGMKIMLTTYFAALGENEDLALALPVDGLHLDLVRAPEQLERILPKLPQDMALSLGLVNGRNIWRVNADRAAGLADRAARRLGTERVMLAPSCSLLHTPLDLAGEAALDPEVRSWLAFAVQKCAEVRLVADAAIGKSVDAALAENRAAIRSRAACERVNNPRVRTRLAEVTEEMQRRNSPFAARKEAQKSLGLPLLPTTTIGSFPQTAEVRAVRRKFKAGKIDAPEYTAQMREFIKEAVDIQHELDLDVLVHGEPERNDMVEYFGEQLHGVCFTQNGWVQSYGSRCVKPPVIFGDVWREKPMTVEWITGAQGMTQKHMKGMLTGPVTILCWSFVRDDQPRRETCRQIALAIRDEVADLERAGVRIIQIDEAALREGMPLKKAEREEYLAWAVESFRLATCCVRNDTQIHTHMCYSEFNEIARWIAAMDADVISIEASRSKMELLEAFREFQYPNDIGPGVYDIHSPRVPSVAEMVSLLEKALEVIPAERLWVNPDCGLKTRGWPESIESLRNMVAAAKQMRARLAAK